MVQAKTWRQFRSHESHAAEVCPGKFLLVFSFISNGAGITTNTHKETVTFTVRL